MDENTKILVLPHCSNVLGCLYDVRAAAAAARAVSPDCIVVVDGVTAAPHRFADFDSLGVDFYVVSMHKFFGPHLGGLVGRDAAMKRLQGEGEGEEVNYRIWERGTVNFEACAGTTGVYDYFAKLASFSSSSDKAAAAAVDGTDKKAVKRLMEEAYYNVELAEAAAVLPLLNKIRCGRDNGRGAGANLTDPFPPRRYQHQESMKLVTHPDDREAFLERRRLPIVSFVHRTVPSDRIVELLKERGIIARAGYFLSEDCLDSWARREGAVEFQGAVRISLCHYNTEEEVGVVLRALDEIDKL